MERFLPQDIPSVRAYADLQGTEVRVETLDIVVELSDGSFMDPRHARALWELERDMVRQFDEIRSLRSITEAIERLHAQTENRGFPADDLDLEEYLLAIDLAADESWLRRYLGEDYRAARVSVEVDSPDSGSTLQVFEDIEAWLSQRSPVDWNVSTTGPMKLLILNIRALVNSQLLSFLVALAAISAVIYLYVRNAAITVASTVVNLLPVLITMGLFPLLAVAGIVSADTAALNASTVMVPGLAMALVVDDTIHFLACYGDARKEGDGVDQSIARAFQRAGFAMTATTVVMVLGLATLYLSVIPANIEFATMLIIAIVAALAADLLLLPNLLRHRVQQRHV
jgi:predicted RND superfamily exporter protein